MLEDCHGDNIVFKSQSLCTTLSGNECPLLTITAPYSSTNTSLPSEVKCKTSQLDPSDEDHSSSQSFAQGTEWSSTAGAEKNRESCLLVCTNRCNMIHAHTVMYTNEINIISNAYSSSSVA